MQSTPLMQSPSSPYPFYVLIAVIVGTVLLIWSRLRKAPPPGERLVATTSESRPAPVPTVRSSTGTSTACAFFGGVSFFLSVPVAIGGLVELLDNTASGMVLFGAAVGAIVSGVLLLALSQHLETQRQILTALQQLAPRAATGTPVDAPIAPDGLPSRAWAPAAK